MIIIKRSGIRQQYSSQKLRKFLVDTSKFTPSLPYVEVDKILKVVEPGLPDIITSNALLKFVAESIATLNKFSYDYCTLSGRVEMVRLYSTTPPTFTEAMLKLQSILSDEFVAKINAYDYSKHIDLKQDFTYDIIGVRTLQRSYLLKDIKGNTVERPQYMLMRVAVFLNDTLLEVLEMYNALSKKYYTHASPTLFHSGMKQHQLASCFLMQMEEDSIDGIFNTVKNCAMVSKDAGGIGISVSNIRGKGTPIKGTNGVSNGLVPMIQVLNSTARYVDQGGGKRKGSFAIYIEPWHVDIEDVVRLKLNTGSEQDRARDLFYGLWVPDLFMECVKADSMWHLFCPSEVPALQETWGKVFESHYQKAIDDGKSRKIIKARSLWADIVRSQIETGTPYMMFKDSCNRKSNHQHLGCIKSSNLCAEIVEYTSKDEVSVCTLASICLPEFVKNGEFDYEHLESIARLACRALNKVIDKTSYPLSQASNSNLRHRPIGIGIQGLHDVFQMFLLPYESDEARRMNVMIAETIYYGAMSESIALASRDGPYQSFAGSPLSHGKFQFDLWGVEPATARYDWDRLRAQVMSTGARNSLLTACMPTASTAQIMGNSESFEPRTSNLYVKRVLSGEFVVLNKYLERACRKQGLWTPDLISCLLSDRGSVGGCLGVLGSAFVTVWECSNKSCILHSVERSVYVDQSQSLNLYLENPSSQSVTSMLFYGWSAGLKTGMYYLRSRAKAAAVQFGVDLGAQHKSSFTESSVGDTVATQLQESECISCSS